MNPIIRKVAGAISWASTSLPIGAARVVDLQGKVIRETSFTGQAVVTVGESFEVKPSYFPADIPDEIPEADDERMYKMMGIDIIPD